MHIAWSWGGHGHTAYHVKKADVQEEGTAGVFKNRILPTVQEEDMGHSRASTSTSTFVLHTAWSAGWGHGGTAGRLEWWLHPVTSQLPQGRRTNHHHRSKFSGGPSEEIAELSESSGLSGYLYPSRLWNNMIWQATASFKWIHGAAVHPWVSITIWTKISRQSVTQYQNPCP